MSRRAFVGALAALSAAGGLGTAGSTILRRRRVAVDKLGAKSAAQLQGNRVALHRDDGTSCDAVVVDVTTRRRRGRWGAPSTEQISILLEPCRGSELSAGNYNLENGEMRWGTLYLSPVGRPGPGQQLEAAITRIV